MWIYDSPVGRMVIKLDKQTGRYSLQVGATIYGNYHSAVAAADDVYTFTTGCSDWDAHDGDDRFYGKVPTDISEWEHCD